MTLNSPYRCACVTVALQQSGGPFQGVHPLHPTVAKIGTRNTKEMKQAWKLIEWMDRCVELWQEHMKIFKLECSHKKTTFSPLKAKYGKSAVSNQDLHDYIRFITISFFLTFHSRNNFKYTWNKLWKSLILNVKTNKKYVFHSQKYVKFP